MPDKLSTSEVEVSTLVFGIAASICSLALAAPLKREAFACAGLSLAMASALFWGMLAWFFMRNFWDQYYAYFYPPWIRSLAPLNLALYTAFGILLWRLTLQLPLPPAFGFALLGGLQGVFEHLLAIYAMGILEKVPLLEELTPLPLIIFSFVEYALYWGVVAWLALGLMHLIKALS